MHHPKGKVKLNPKFHKPINIILFCGALAIIYIESKSVASIMATLLAACDIEL